MAEKLPATVDTLDKIPEAARGFYEQAANGKFALAVDGLSTGVAPEEFEKVKEALTRANNEAATRRKALEKWDGLGLAPEDVASLLEAEEARKRQEAEKKGEWDKLAEQMAQSHAKTLSKKDEELGAVKKQLDTVLRENAARAALEKAEAFVHIALPHVLDKTEMRNIDGALRAVVLNDAGEPRVDGDGKFLTIDALVDEMAKDTERWGALFKAPTVAGGGANGRGGARGAGNKAFKDMSDAERMELIDSLSEKHGPQEAKRLYHEMVRGTAA